MTTTAPLEPLVLHTIARVALPVPLSQCFDYTLPENSRALPGVRVEVPFGARTLVGVVVETVPTSTYAILKTAYRVLDEIPIFSSLLLTLCDWISAYYHAPIGEVLMLALPKALRQGKPVVFSPRTHHSFVDKKSPSITLTAEQQEALKAIIQKSDSFNVCLLHGITGSGKTQVYLDSIAHVTAQGKQALVLVPEIGLTPQTLARFENYFDVPVVAFHSGLTEKKRLQAWLQASTGAACIVIGTRSAVFLPFAALGLIVLDEEHDGSFKQQEGVRYSARDVAIKRAQLHNIPVILGSATPSLESYYNAKQGRYWQAQLIERAGLAIKPVFSVIDLRHKTLKEGLSAPLLEAISQHVERKEQVLLFLNRRGFSPVWICHACGWVAQCLRCNARFTYHRKKQLLQCHHCTNTKPVPRTCPACAMFELHAMGVGTQRLEEALSACFPGVEVVRIDRDSTQKKNSLQNLLDTVHKGGAQILVGTQMLAKGHHFPNVTLVGIVNVDDGLFSHDFRGLERMAQLIVQVAGRAGRADKPGVVMLQTHQPEHPILQSIVQQDYDAVIALLLEERKKAFFPPFGFLALLRAEALTEDKPLQFLQDAAVLVRDCAVKGVRLLGPAPSAMPKKAGKYRSELLLLSSNRKALQGILFKLAKALPTTSFAKQVHWLLDVDPSEFF